MDKSNLQSQILIPFTHSFSLLPVESADRIARQLWWMNQELSLCHHHSTMVLHAHLSPSEEQ
jgi:hypothetical protein